MTTDGTFQVGDMVYLPDRLQNGPFPDLNAALREPGRVAAVADGWAMVEYATWGQFGCAVGELKAATHDIG